MKNTKEDYIKYRLERARKTLEDLNRLLNLKAGIHQ